MLILRILLNPLPSRFKAFIHDSQEKTILLYSFNSTSAFLRQAFYLKWERRNFVK
jgi:hypothetical protein